MKLPTSAHVFHLCMMPVLRPGQTKLTCVHCLLMQLDNLEWDEDEDGAEEGQQDWEEQAVDPLTPSTNGSGPYDPSAQYYNPQSPYRVRSNLEDMLSPESRL